MSFFKNLFKKKENKETINSSDEISLNQEKINNELESIENEKDKTENKSNENIDEKTEKLEDKKEDSCVEAIENEELVEKNDKVEEDEEEIIPVEKKTGFFASLKEKLTKSRTGFFGTLKSLIVGRSIIDDDMYEELEEVLIQSDIGYDMTEKIVSALSKEVKKRNAKDPKEVYPILKDIMEDFLIKDNNDIVIKDGITNVIMVVGVNGVGKTTTIGKLAAKYIKDGKKVILGAADTFRAAATEQLEEWAKRSGAEIVKGAQGSDPGAVVFDALDTALKNKTDIVIIDTAGRLHNKNNLMMELEKLRNIIKKKIGDQYYESLLVIDGTTGQNAIEQAKVFNEVMDLTGFIITKLDGTAKGGIVFSISELLRKPIKYIGVGEKIDDLRKFDAKEYINAIFDQE